MKVRLSRISPFQSSKVLAVLYFLLSIPLVLIMGLFSMFMPGQHGGASIIVMLLMPILYAVFGFIFSLIGIAIYNLAASWVGGIEYTTEEK